MKTQLLLIAGLCLLIGCGSGGGNNTVGGNGVTISLTPAASSLAPGSTQTFTAQVANTTNTAVTWTVQEGAAERAERWTPAASTPLPTPLVPTM